MTEPLEDAVRRSVAKVLSIPLEDVLLEDDLHTALGADSLDEVQIAMELEEVLDIQFPDSEFDSIKTVEQLIQTTAQLVFRAELQKELKGKK